MADCKRTKKIQSLFNVTKSSPGILLAIYLALSSLAGCSTLFKSSERAEKQVADTFQKAMDFRPSGEPVTKLGTNSSPSWSPDGTKFLFVSSNRNTHKNAQIYEWDLSSNTERRVTFSDGDSGSPSYDHDGGRIIYSSTTDELKDRPLLLQKKNENSNQLPPSDIYMSKPNGLDIIRLTNHPGFDGLIHLSAGKENEIYFSSENLGVRSIFKMHLNRNNVFPVFPDSKVQRFDFVHMNDKSAWIEVVDGRSQLMYSEGSLKKSQSLDFGDKIFRDLSWVPGMKKGEEQLLATVTFKEITRSQIMLIDLNKKCLAPIVKTEKGSLREGSLSADKKNLLYSSDEVSGTSQVLIKNLNWDDVKCKE